MENRFEQNEEMREQRELSKIFYICIEKSNIYLVLRMKSASKNAYRKYILKMKKILCLVIATSLLSCASYRKINMSSINLGMTKQEVTMILNRNPDNVIGAKKYNSGTVEVVQYSRKDLSYDRIVERYWLYFYNGKLEQWGRPGDWEKEADHVYEIRVR